MRHIKKFNEGYRDDVKNDFLSTFTATGSLEKHSEDIKNDILVWLDELLDDEVEVLAQMSRVQNGELSPDEIDMNKVMSISKKFNDKLMSISRSYMRR